jgi:E3 ubiquitin-protein ligase SHPRH
MAAPAGEPAAKRRKVDGAPQPHEVRHATLNYISLAKADIVVHLDSAPHSLDVAKLVRLPMEVRFNTQPDRPDETVVFASKRSSGPRLALTCRERVNDRDVQVIRDCARLEAYQQHDPARPKLPLLCAYTTLDLLQGAAVQSPVAEMNGTLRVRLLWHDSVYTKDPISPEILEVLYRYQLHGALPGSVSRNQGDSRRPLAVPAGLGHHPSLRAEPWEPREFYDNVHVPEKTAESSADIRIDLLETKLFSFQRRAVRWLLSREGVFVQPSGQVQDLPAKLMAPSPVISSGIEGSIEQHQVPGPALVPRGFVTGRDADGETIYVNKALGVVSSSLEQVKAVYGTIRGGILSEEMGLGKTVELIALICLNTRRLADRLDDAFPGVGFQHGRDHEGSSSLSPGSLKTGNPTTDLSPSISSESSQGQSLAVSRATLIITPPTILEQWKQEIREHAPSLKIYHYEGMKAAKQKTALVQHLADHDIVLTTYNVIAKEVHYVTEKPDRNLRYKSRFEPPKSPLTQISWWRVCLDEAQMIESGVSAAATVARLIPRENAWAVTGTPLRSGHKDLFGLLLFLRYEPWCQSLKLWNRLVHFHRPLFRSLMKEIAIRHSKDFVREDLRLPPQSRQTITVPFTAIEEQYYAQLFHEMYEDCGLDRNGAPVSDDWDPEAASVTEKMRTWLTRLRQTCLHPEVGGRNRRALGRSGGPLRSVQQVLDVMIDQNDTAVRLEQRVLLLSQIRRGQMMENAKATQQSMEIWKLAYGESCTIVDECRTQLNAELELQKQEEDDLATDKDSQNDDSEPDARLTTVRQRLRSALEVKHICIFFIANAYFQLKSDETKIKPDSEEFLALQRQEEDAYEEAKTLRTELLSEVLRKANRLILNVRTKADNNGFTSLPKMELLLDYAGIESRKVFEKLENFCNAMNLQADQFNQLRQKMIDFLRQSLIDEDEGVELQGDEYESSTKHQDEMYAYMEALRALFADRSDALSGQENTLIRHEMKVLLRTAKEGEGPAPQVLIQLLAEREKCRMPSEYGSLRGIVTEIRALITSLQWQDSHARARAELSIATDILQHAQKHLSAQTKSITTLEQEVNQFRDTMNSRLDYYRALQKISDMVAPFEEERVGQPVDDRKYASMLDDEAKKNDKLSALLAKRRYLQHLKTESSSTTPRLCTICQCDFEIGTLTVCGHQFCKECIQLWYVEHHNCPVCKKRLRGSDFWDITYKPAELAIQEETNASMEFSPNSPTNSSERSLGRSIYSDISRATLNEIKDIDLHGASFGSKVDTITRHLFWLRDHDPGSKVVIFSQYREFLDVLGRAFQQYKITFTRFDDKNGIERFKTDPAVECFLLHAKAHSAGLNLVVANHVFLCEPLINTAIELQAIARVHRIGQHRTTTVWMYLITDTVEESIYEISVARRLAHLKGKSKAGFHSRSRSGTTTPGSAAGGAMENAIDAANSMELQAANLSRLLTSGKSGGEIVEKDDLWQCLFGRVRKRDVIVSDSMSPTGEMGRFLRAEAAEGRRAVELPTR